MKIAVVCPMLLVAGAGLAVAHPHFNKTVTAKLPQGVEASVTYNTTPANEVRAAEAPVGTFVTPRRPLLKLSGALETGSVTVPGGEYTLGVIKNGEKDWTMALYPGALGRGDKPDVAKAIKLESAFSSDHGVAEHMLIDITPGAAKLEGRAVLTLHFGGLFLSGALAGGNRLASGARSSALIETRRASTRRTSLSSSPAGQARLCEGSRMFR